MSSRDPRRLRYYAEQLAFDDVGDAAIGAVLENVTSATFAHGTRAFRIAHQLYDRLAEGLLFVSHAVTGAAFIN
jgi:hypothetical protein